MGALARVRSGQISYSNKWARSPNQSISTLHISIWYEIRWFIFVLFVYFFVYFLTRRHSVTDRISTERKRDILQNSFFVDWCREPRGVTLVGWRRQGVTTCGLSSLASFLKILSSKHVCCVFRDIRDKNAVIKVFGAKLYRLLKMSIGLRILKNTKL